MQRIRISPAARRGLAWALAAALLPAGLLATSSACSSVSEARSNGAAADEPSARPGLVVVEARPTPEHLVLTGTVTPDRSSDVAADMAGKVVATFVERGQLVKAGEPLVRLDVRSAALGASEARAQLASARAQAELARAECERSAQLYAKGAITKASHDRDQAQCVTSTQQVAAAEARVRLSDKQVGDGVVRAPFTGLVEARFVDAGEWVGPGARLLTLVDADPLVLELTVPEAEVARVQPGQAVEFGVVAQPGKTYQAKVSRIGAEVSRRDRSLVVEATVAPGSDLRPGMFAEARLVVGETTLPVVPKTALRRRGSTWRLLEVDGDRLAERVVQLGPELPGDVVAIRRGLAEGARVAAPLTDALADGTRLQ